MQRPILNISMEQMRQYSHLLASKLQDKNINVIVPILKGGVVLASMLGRDLGVNQFSCLHINTTVSDTQNAEFHEPICLGITNENVLNGANVLIVDDICDTGRSLMFAKDYIKKFNPHSVDACVAINVNSEQKGKILCAEDFSKEKYWIVFPWED